MTAPTPDGYLYLLTYTERQTVDSGAVQLNSKALELSNTTEDAVRDRISVLLGDGNVQDVSLQRRLPTPAWEDVAL
ncbi:hypothetical protein [Mycolicibacterium mucogenicum]|uniref:Uncharacterized protein n=1 Tax=Mycolicibacterium mucogenicum DSM 44124 TaxID=1226753 RepID=A0A8H2JGQ8_MYCMU|nr:hypothetical protein [Mycolicibacterium mucogenicum]KAB7752870.1 hypothetical protein MMUC44124_26405 [Mycolicibacterium mucogenicum DSM 44124]QPG69075.1 hypothetical protein C1S78_027430 [Mycolicibacterium mucogenicum DSM 44124]